MGNVKNKKASIDLELNVTQKNVIHQLEEVMKKLDTIQTASTLDLKFANIKGISELIKNLADLDKKLNAISADSKIAGNGLSQNISNSASDAIKNISIMSSKTSEFAKELSTLASASDLGKIQGKVKQLAEAINSNLKLLGSGYQINIDELLNLGDAQKQINMLSDGLKKFTVGWSYFGSASVRATDELRSGLNQTGADIDGLKSKLRDLQDLTKRFKTAFSSIKTYSDKGLTKDEMKNAKEFAANARKIYQETNAQLREVVPKSKEYYQIYAKMVVAVNDMMRVQNSRAYNSFADKDLKSFYTSNNGATAIINSVHNWSDNIKSKIEQSLVSLMDSIQKQINSATIPVEPNVEVKPKVNVDKDKEILSIVDQLQKAFDIGHKKNTLEYKILFTTEGLDIRNGDFQGIDTKTYAESLLGNLTNNIKVNAHSHMGKYSEFTLPDIKSAVEAKENLGINLSAVIGPDDIATLDLTKVKLEDLYILLEKLSKLPLANKSMISADDLNKALQEINSKYTDVFQKWKPEKFDELANYIYKITQASDSAINPLERFKNIISFLFSKNIDFSKYQGLLDSLVDNNFSPKSLQNVFNEIAKAENIMSEGKLLQIDIPEKSTLDIVTKSLQEQIDKYKTLRKEAGITYDRIRQEVTNWFDNSKPVDDSFFKRFFHPIEADDILELLNGNDSIDMITQKLATKFNVEVPVKPKVETKDIENSYSNILDILNKIAAKEKEIQAFPPTPAGLENIEYPLINFENVGDSVDQYRKQIKEVFNEYYSLKNELKLSQNKFKDSPEMWEDTAKRFETVKSQIAGIVVAAEQAGIKLEDVFNGQQLKAINSDNNGIKDLVSQWKEYELLIDPIEKKNILINNSINDLINKILELAKSANVSKDAYNSIVGMLFSIDETTAPDQINKITTSINNLLNDAIPQITTLKEELANAFPDKNIDGLELKYINLFDEVEKGSLTAAQALEQIKQEEEAIANAAKTREKVQSEANKRNNESQTSKGTTTVTSSAGVPNGTATTSQATSTEIENLERLKVKLTEIQAEIAKKTQAFNDEGVAVTSVVDSEIKDLERLKEELKKVETAVDNKTTAFKDEKTDVENLINSEIEKINELEQKINSVTEKIKNISAGKENMQVESEEKIVTESNDSVNVNADSSLSSSLSSVNHTLETLNSTLIGFTAQKQPESPKLDIQGISNIADDVHGIYEILNKNPNSDNTLANSVKSAVEELSNASKYIAEDAKLRNESNQKYKTASDRIATEAGRKSVLDSATSAYSNYSIPDESSVKYSALSNGVVKVEAVLKDAEGKLYDFAATVDNQGTAAIQKLEENGAKSIEVQKKIAEQEKILAKAREQAAEEQKKMAEQQVNEINKAEIKKIDAQLQDNKKRIDELKATLEARQSNPADGISDSGHENQNINTVDNQQIDAEKAKAELQAKIVKIENENRELLALRERYIEDLTLSDEDKKSLSSILGDFDKSNLVSNIDNKLKQSQDAQITELDSKIKQIDNEIAKLSTETKDVDTMKYDSKIIDVRQDILNVKDEISRVQNEIDKLEKESTEKSQIKQEKVSKIDTRQSEIGAEIKSLESKKVHDTWIDSVLNKIYSTSGSKQVSFMFDPTHADSLDDTSLKNYQKMDEELQKIGYHLGEVKKDLLEGMPVQWVADIVPNSEKVVTNLEEARNILTETERKQNAPIDNQIEALKRESATLAEEKKQLVASENNNDNSSELKQLRDELNDLNKEKERLNEEKKQLIAEKSKATNDSEQLTNLKQQREELNTQKYDIINQQNAAVNQELLYEVTNKLNDNNKKIAELQSKINAEDAKTSSNSKENSSSTNQGTGQSDSKDVDTAKQNLEEQIAEIEKENQELKERRKQLVEAMANIPDENAKSNNKISLNSIDGVLKETKKQYENFSGVNEVPDTLKDNYTNLLKIIKEVQDASRTYSQDEINSIESICRGIQQEIGELQKKNNILAEQKSLYKKYNINTSDLFDNSKAGNIVGSGYEDKVKDIIKEIQNEINKLNQTDNGKIKILDADALEQSKARLKELNNELQNTVKEAQNAAKGSFAKAYEKQFGTLNAAFKNFKKETDGLTLDNNIANTVTKYEDALKRLGELKTKLEQAPKGSDTSDLVYQWQNACNEAKKYQKELEKVLQISKSVEDGNSIFDINSGVDVNDIEQVRTSLEKYINSIAHGRAEIQPFDYENKKLTATFVDTDGMIKKVTLNYDALNHVVGQTTTTVKKATTGWDKLTSSINKKMVDMASYFSTFFSVYQVVAQIRKGIGYIKEIDDALTQLKKVTDETNESYQKFLQNMSKTASAVGSTVADLTNSAADGLIS